MRINLRKPLQFFSGAFFFLWVLSIIVFFLNLIYGTETFTKDIQSTSYGQSLIFNYILLGSVFVGVLSFVMGTYFGFTEVIRNTFKWNKKYTILSLVVGLFSLFTITVLALNNFDFETYMKYNMAPNSTASLSLNGDDDITDEQARKAIIERVNLERKKKGLPALIESEKLRESAKAKAFDMLERDYWSHNTPEGQEPWILFGDAGYQYRFAGENLARDFLSVEPMVQGWINSKLHYENMMNKDYTETGVYVMKGDFLGAQTVIAVQHFGTPLSVGVSYADVNTPPRIIKYREWCTGKDINIYNNELIVRKASDGNTYSMTASDWDCYEGFKRNEIVPQREPSRTGNIIPYKEFCTGNQISVYENELIYRKAHDGKIYSMTAGDWQCYDNLYQ